MRREEQMQLLCWYCHTPVSNPLPEDTLFRAIAVCPECIAKSPEAEGHPLPDRSHESALTDRVRELEETLKLYHHAAQYVLEEADRYGEASYESMAGLRTVVCDFERSLEGGEP